MLSNVHSEPRRPRDLSQRLKQVRTKHTAHAGSGFELGEVISQDVVHCCQAKK